MKKMVFLFLVLVVMSGCSVTSEKYRYQWRFDKFYNLLSETEKASFKSDELKALGESIEKRMSLDAELSNQFEAMQSYEAITSFDGEQTAHFFKYIILRELNREVFYQFMNYLDDEAQIAFVRGDTIFEKLNILYDSKPDFKNFINSIKDEYRLYDYSLKEIYDFFRKVSFPEVSRRELYSVLRFLRQCNGVTAFLEGAIPTAAIRIDEQIKAIVTAELEFQKIKDATSLSKVGAQDFLYLYYDVIMKEMDAEAVKKTVAKFATQG